MPSSNAQVLGILGGCAILFVAGLLDDMFSLPPLAKIAAQLAAAAVVLAAGLKVTIVVEPLARARARACSGSSG